MTNSKPKRQKVDEVSSVEPAVPNQGAGAVEQPTNADTREETGGDRPLGLDATGDPGSRGSGDSAAVRSPLGRDVELEADTPPPRADERCLCAPAFRHRHQR